MNIHHLELFYYVARYGGISEAVRNIPYGIQQPAVSSQVIQLEESLGAKLFNRRPFELTAAGAKLFAFVEPFFSRVDEVTDAIRGTETHHLRVGASTAVLRDHLPAVFRAMQARASGARLTLHEGLEPELLSELEKKEIDLAITSIDRKPAAGLSAQELLTLPLVLLVPSASRLRSADELWQRDKIEETLIAPPPGEAVCRCFQRGLAERQVDWLTGIRVNSLELIESYVLHGFGIGLSVQIPQKKPAPGLRALPLEGFDPIRLCAIWRGKLTPPIKLLVEELRKRAAAVLA